MLCNSTVRCSDNENAASDFVRTFLLALLDEPRSGGSEADLPVGVRFRMQMMRYFDRYKQFQISLTFAYGALRPLQDDSPHKVCKQRLLRLTLHSIRSQLLRNCFIYCMCSEIHAVCTNETFHATFCFLVYLFV